MRSYVISTILISLFLSTLSAADETKNFKNSKCAQIYYDRAPTRTDKDYYVGRLKAIALQNLVSHFPHIQQYIIPIDLYQRGQLERCDSSIYIGSYYNNPLPKDFIDDFIKTKKNVAWIHYNIWQLSPEQLNQLWSVKFLKNAETDWIRKDKMGRPGVYNFFKYKGQTFERCSNFSYAVSIDALNAYYNIGFDISLLQLLNQDAEKNVISWANFTTENKKTPYIIRKNNHWYVADDPFSYICEGDRYFIFADILFDILNEPPQDGGKKYALVRYEDVSPKQSLTKITRLADMFHDLHIPFSIALIPIYRDPLAVYNYGPYLEMNGKKNFTTALKYAKEQGGNFIFHGVTHQYNNQRDPFSGVSGEDFEFWNRETNKAVSEDSVDYALNRLDKGDALIRQAGLQIVAWMTPHYLGSFLDNVIFGKVFAWNVSRGNYGVAKVCNAPNVMPSLTYDIGNKNTNTALIRNQLLHNIKVSSIEEDNQINQIFPYPIYGDYYGRNVIPEDLGNIQPYFSTQVIAKRTVDQLIQDAKKYTVLRDTWASFFIHDILLNTISNNGIAKEPGDTSELRRLIQSIKNDGYEFVDLKKWTAAHLNVKRFEPIEIDPPGEPCSEMNPKTNG